MCDGLWNYRLTKFRGKNFYRNLKSFQELKVIKAEDCSKYYVFVKEIQEQIKMHLIVNKFFITIEIFHL